MDLEGGPRLRQRLQRHVHAAGLDVVEHGVTMAERAALDVLAGQADAGAVGQDRRKRQLLGVRPVHRPLVGAVERRTPLLAHPLELAVHREIRRQRQQRRVQLAQPIERHGRFAFAAAPGGGASGSGSTRVLFGPQRVERRLQLGRCAAWQIASAVVGRDHAALDQRARPDLAHGRMRPIFWYINGWVNDGSSPSLWPYRR